MLTVIRKLGRYRLASILAAVGMISMWMYTQAAYVHTPHFYGQTSRVWSSIDLKGTLGAVEHLGTDTFKSSATSEPPSQQEFKIQANIYWADRHCTPGGHLCWWDTEDHQSAINTATSVKETISFYAEDCRDYKFYSKHWHLEGEDNRSRKIDPNNMFRAGCEGNSIPVYNDPLPEDLPVEN